MSHNKTQTVGNQDFFQIDKNQELVLRLFRSYYRSHQTTGKLFDDFPDFFLVKHATLNNPELVERASDKLILSDCVQRAQARNGYIGVSKWLNPKLKYYWLELSVFPYMLGDEVTQNNQGEFFYLLGQFIQYTKLHPKVYGDLTAEIDSDKDLALMLAEINKRGAKLNNLLPHYPLDMLVKHNPNWPVGEVNKLMQALKGSDQSWCDVFFEYIIYVMGKKQ
ncbi:MAG: hypothetical protein PXX77_10335 [Gallionella sp.]|nr:hypothetical protein [Gallionella sp.]